MIGLDTQSEEKVRNVTSPSHKVESREVLDSGEKHSLANTVQFEIELISMSTYSETSGIEKTWLTKIVTTDGTKSAILMQF